MSSNPFPVERTFTPPASFREVKPLSFIYERPNTIPADWCEEMIRRFEAHPEQQNPGRIGQVQGLDTGVKRTMDLVVSNNPDWQDVDQLFFRCMAAAIKEFREAFPFFKGPFKDMGYQIQRYLPGEYYHWHIDGGSHQFADRQLVALWYLNDVPEGAGGRTQFLYQDVSVRPEQGKMILFPPFWTHEHRSEVLTEGVKYIATTWVVFR
ncbi:MAG: 2OG-Fe(II) oxygenase [Gammaproteobacteria bacterium]|nr:MAG: 2OG-Fe(II) oxygenase [Gammaproteobacteria bacterium]